MSTVTPADGGGFTVDPDGTGANSFNVPPLDFDLRSLIGNAVLRWNGVLEARSFWSGNRHAPNVWLARLESG